MRISPPLVGVALGGWWAAQLALWHLLSSAGWFFGSELPTDLRYPPSHFFGPGGAFMLAGIFLLGGVLLTVCWSWLEDGLGMDPERKAWRSIRWTARVFLRGPTLVLTGAVVVLIYLSNVSEYFLYALLAVAVLFILLVPFAVYRKEEISSASGLRWWRPQWPGWTALTMVGALLGTTVLFPFLLEPLAQAHWTLGMAAPIADLVVGSGISLALAAVLIFRPEWADIPRFWHRLNLRQVVGPVLAQAARVILLSLFAMAPIVAIWLWDWKILPLHTQWLRQGDSGMPGFLVLFAQTVNSVGRYWWLLVFLPPLPLLSYLLTGRLVWLIADEPARSAASHSPEGR